MRESWPYSAVVPFLALAASAAHGQSIDDLRGMSIGDLANIEVLSASKMAMPLAEAPAAIFVIDHDMILRSGAQTVPEILRLAPNLEVYRQNGSAYVVTARGLNGNQQAQNFSNKLLVLIDGRSVYSPLYSGVYWDMQDLLPDDIDRIEVISGPGATLWGANAVNGVINIITREAGETQGLLLQAQGGAFERSAGIRMGGQAAPSLDWRLFVRGDDGDESWAADGTAGADDWHRLAGGFRIDWQPGPADRIMAQAGLFTGRHGQPGIPDETSGGGHFLVNWNHEATNGNQLQIKGYFDNARRETLEDGGHFWVNTVDLELQHQVGLGGIGSLVWGGDLRASRYRIAGANGLVFVPEKRTLWLASGFAQATVGLTPQVSVVAGLKVEDDPYLGASILPDARISWTPLQGTMLWAAVSRAIRAPTPFDIDVREYLDTTLFITGNPDFRSEKLTSFELGGRFQPADALSFSISAYYNLHRDLRSVELSPDFLPLYWGNKLEGKSYGVELWASLQPAPWWTLAASLDISGSDFDFAPGASQLLGMAQLGSDPGEQASLRSSMNFGDINADVRLRYVGPLPEPYLASYTEADARLGWRLNPALELSLSGSNLLHGWHQEYPGGNRIPRQVQIGVKWRL